VQLTSAVCLVTGASGGIGRAVALRLAGRGARLVLLGRRRAALEAVAAATEGRVVVADLGVSGDVLEAADRALEAFGRVDVVVNNAGIGWAGAFTELDEREAEQLVAVNLLAPILLTRALLPAMLGRGRGHVVNIASIVGHTGGREEAVYAATKAGLVAFGESLRQELDNHGVGLSLVTPGVVQTPFFDRRGSPYDRRWPRPIRPERVADAVVRAIEQNRAEVFVPAWMTVPARVRGALPGLYRALASRFG
jgi:short-subunit dehydrogenase